MQLKQIKPSCMFLFMVEPCPAPVDRTLLLVAGLGDFPIRYVSKWLVPGHNSLWLCVGTKIRSTVYPKCVQSK